MEFRDRIKGLRNQSNISAVELAQKLGKSESAIRMWESGKTKPDADTLIELSKLFNCSTDFLLGISDFESIDMVNKANRTIEEFILRINNLHPEDKISLLHVLNKIIDDANIFSIVYGSNQSTVIEDLLEIICLYGEMFTIAALLQEHLLNQNRNKSYDYIFTCKLDVATSSLENYVYKVGQVLKETIFREYPTSIFTEAIKYLDEFIDKEREKFFVKNSNQDAE